MIRLTRPLAALLSAALVGCARAPETLEVTPLADGEWIVQGLTERGAVLRKTHDIQPRDRRALAPATPEFALLTDSLIPADADSFTLFAGDTPITLARIAGGAFFTSWSGQAPLRRSPAGGQFYVFQTDDAIWAFKAPDSINQLTRDDDVDALKLRQREGRVILYWSVDPVWSGDGEFIAFLSNREAVRAGSHGQSMWTVDLSTGIERALYDAPRVSVHTEAAFGDEFVFISDAEPGVFAVQPRTRRTRKLGNGYVLATHPRGLALLLNNNGRLELLQGSRRDTLPAPPDGHVWSTHASLSPAGDRVAIYSTDQAGVFMLHVLGTSGHVRGFTLPAPPSQPPSWIGDDGVIFSVQQRGSLRTYRASLR